MNKNSEIFCNIEKRIDDIRSEKLKTIDRIEKENKNVLGICIPVFLLFFILCFTSFYPASIVFFSLVSITLGPAIVIYFKFYDYLFVKDIANGFDFKIEYLCRIEKEIIKCDKEIDESKLYTDISSNLPLYGFIGEHEKRLRKCHNEKDYDKLFSRIEYLSKKAIKRIINMVSSGNIQYDVNILDYVVSDKEVNSSACSIPPVNHEYSSVLKKELVREKK